MRLFTFIAIALLMSSFFPTDVHAQSYWCWDDHPTLGNKQILPGRCYQRPAAGNPVPEEVRIASYVRCRVYKGGRDEYTSNCCEHITNADASYLKVCSGRTNPESGLGLAIQIGTVLNTFPLLCQKIDCDYIVEW